MIRLRARSMVLIGNTFSRPLAGSGRISGSSPVTLRDEGRVERSNTGTDCVDGLETRWTGPHYKGSAGSDRSKTTARPRWGRRFQSRLLLQEEFGSLLDAATLASALAPWNLPITCGISCPSRDWFSGRPPVDSHQRSIRQRASVRRRRRSDHRGRRQCCLHRPFRD